MSGKWANSQRRHQLPGDWRSRRARVLRRDKHTCVTCGNKATDVDHIADRHDHTLPNLQALCAQCHKTKTQREAQAARAANAPFRNPPIDKRLRPTKPHPGLI